MRATLAVVVLVLSGCAPGFRDENGNYFHSMEEKKAFDDASRGDGGEAIKAAMLGRHMRDVIAAWGMPETTISLGRGSAYEWVRYSNSWVAFGVHCNVTATTDEQSIVVSVNTSGRCLKKFADGKN